MIDRLKFPKRNRGLDIHVPTPNAERRHVKRVGILAAVGFVIGVLWPRFAGVQLVPAAPIEPVDSAAPAAATQKSQPPAPTAKLAAERGKGSTEPATDDDATGHERIIIKSTEVTSCRDADGHAGTQCDEPDFGSAFSTRIKALKDCDGTRDARGIFSLGLEVDFATKRVARVLRGRSTTLPSAMAKRLAACAEADMKSVSLEGIEHQRESYIIFHIVEFLSPSESRANDAADEEEQSGLSATAASGRATVGWQVALIRAEPEDGEVVARLLSGTNVVVTARQGDWYKVRYDAKGNEGWVFKAAIGL